MKIDPNAPASAMTIRAEIATRLLEQQFRADPEWVRNARAKCFRTRAAKASVTYADALIAELNAD